LNAPRDPGDGTAGTNAPERPAHAALIAEVEASAYAHRDFDHDGGT